MVKTTIQSTGEVIELEVEDLKSLMNAYMLAQEYEKASKDIKDQLKELLPAYLDEFGKSDELDGKQFKQVSIQRMTYDKAVLRQVFDEDLLDLFLKPDKSQIDRYIKEHLDELGEDSTKLRKAMIVDGKPYTQVKLEKITREN